MSMSVNGKVAFITGAGGGIGRASALLFAQLGARVVVTDISQKLAEETAALVQEAGGEALAMPQDVVSEEEWITSLKAAAEHFGCIDVLVNNAGIYVIAALTDTTLEQWNRLMAINVTSIFLGSKHVVPYMVERNGGSIINLSSVAGLLGSAGHTLYGASKGAVRIMTKDMAAELAPQNIRVNSIHPGYVKTAMADYATEVSGLSAEQLGQRLSPLGRLAEASDVANMVVFLAAEESSYLNGSEFVVDGGGTQILKV